MLGFLAHWPTPACTPSSVTRLDPLGVFTEGAVIEGGDTYNELYDFNGDGFLDVFSDVGVGSSAGGRVLLNNGDATFTPLPPVASSLTLDTYPVDLNNDGFTDVFNFDIDQSGDGVIQVFVNRADGTAMMDNVQTLNSGINFAGLEASTNAKFADIDGDAFLDAILVDPRQRRFVTFRNNHNATFSYHSEMPMPSWLINSATDFMLAELTGDLAPDMIIGPTLDSARRVAVIVNNGDGTFDPTRAVFMQERSAAGMEPFLSRDQFNISDIAVGDIDGNGLNDIVFADRNSSSGGGPTLRGNKIWFNQGIGVVPDGTLLVESWRSCRHDSTYFPANR